MKKNINISMLAIAGIVLTSCEGDDFKFPVEPVNYAVVPYGYMLNQGSYGANNASVTAMYLRGGESYLSPDFYLKNNGQNLGDQAQDILFSEAGRVFVSVTNSKYIAKLDRDGRELTRYDAFTNGPRSMVEVNGDIFLSTYDGKVLRLDTASLAVKATYEVGAYLEDIAAAAGWVVVTNSDYTGMGLGHSLGVINLATGTVSEVECEVNPTRLVAYNGDFFFTTTSYDAYWNAVTKVWRLRYPVTVNQIDSVTLATNLYPTDDALLMMNQSVNYYVTPYAYTNTFLRYTDDGKESSVSETVPFQTDLSSAPVYMVQQHDGRYYVGIANFAASGAVLNSSLLIFDKNGKLTERIADAGGVFLSKIAFAE
jgi:hypothetical protein